MGEKVSIIKSTTITKAVTSLFREAKQRSENDVRLNQIRFLRLQDLLAEHAPLQFLTRSPLPKLHPRLRAVFSDHWQRHFISQSVEVLKYRSHIQLIRQRVVPGNNAIFCGVLRQKFSSLCDNLLGRLLIMHHFFPAASINLPQSLFNLLHFQYYYNHGQKDVGRD